LGADLYHEGTPVLQLVYRLAGARRHILGGEPEALAVGRQHRPRVVAPASRTGRIEGGAESGDIDLAECFLTLVHDNIDRAGEVVCAGEGQHHACRSRFAGLQSRIEQVVAFRGDIALVGDTRAGRQHAGVIQAGSHLEPGRARAYRRIAGDRYRRIEFAPYVTVDELRLLHTIIAGVEQAGCAFLLRAGRDAIRLR